ncbi:hypothetical protein CLOSTMETH_00470 [[Clostridium] methylpentosum DSM 5476]|uniref:Uncharacterized protein n=1 Tax=[Clostridium] methylpentosum DSM 5476 TaxID=537013 RepID=C0E9H1_9FIRM|nr:hypothetical protein CLOSTMETH_00470 [[Clostridium] methylpentosum DSM 5476]
MHAALVGFVADQFRGTVNSRNRPFIKGLNDPDTASCKWLGQYEINRFLCQNSPILCTCYTAGTAQGS